MEGNDLNSQASVLFLPRVNPNARPELRCIRTGNTNCRFNGKRICRGGESGYTARLTTDSKLGPVLGCWHLVLRHVSFLYGCHRCLCLSSSNISRAASTNAAAAFTSIAHSAPSK